MPRSIRLTIRQTNRQAWLVGVLVLMVSTVTSPHLQAQDSRTQLDELKTGFMRPPQAAKPSAYWLWLNGYANREYMDRELKAFADLGIGGLCIFDMGARGNAKFCPPAGPEFMGEESLETIAEAITKANQYGMNVQLATSSSWDLGGSWVSPEHASMALYRTELRVEGPFDLDTTLPSPSLPASIPKTAGGKPAFQKEIALLAIPETKRLPAHEFIFELPRGNIHKIDHVILYNSESDRPERYGELHLFAKDFSVAVSDGQPQVGEFREIVKSSLKPNTEPQRFDFPTTDARYVRLRIASGHNPDFDQIQLGEFEVYSTEGVNVAGSYEIDRTRDTAEIIWHSSEAARGKSWTVSNLNDGSKTGSTGIWSYAGPPPLVIEDRSRIINLTDRVDADGGLKWKVPSGRWTLMRFVCANTGERLKVPSPNSDGLATDHFNAEATRAYIQTLIDRLQSKLGDLQSAGIKQLYLPSYEVRGSLWTPDFLSQFEKYRQYDMTNYLPAFAGCKIESDDRTQRFLYDFQKSLGDLLVDAYYRTASETAHRAGLGIEAEAGGPGPPVHHVPVDALKALGAIDEMRGEFWPWRLDRNQLWVVKETACAAHVYGRPRVHMEAFTGFRHWQDGPFDLKPSADRAFCEGMNHVVWHTSSHQPPEAGKPGWVYGAGTHLTPNLAWWPLAKPYIDYLARSSFMLQRGLFVADVCYYYGDQGANFVPPKHIDPSLGYGYDYDVANPEVVLDRMTVRDGRIRLPDGMQYELLVLPDRQDFDLQVLQKIEQLVKAGATVVGPKPIRSNGLTDYPARGQRVQQLAERIWGNCDGQTVLEHHYGEGRVVWGRSLREILSERGSDPDFGFSSESNDSQLDYIHRQTDEADIYFVRNMTARPESVTAEFRVTGKTPELWFPDSGEVRELAVYEERQQSVRVPLQLERNGSVFVVFRKPAHELHLTSASKGLEATRLTNSQVQVTVFHNGDYQLRTSADRVIPMSISKLPATKELAGPWRVSFPEGWGAPKSITLKELTSWTEHEDEGVRNFSGVATYETTFDVPASILGDGRRLYLDLGKLWAVGRVRLNGKLLGVLWKPPYRTEITNVVRAGQNDLEVEIANTWANRLVGDANLLEDERFCQTNITSSGTPGIPWKQVPLRESGLFGPVKLIPAFQKIVPISARSESRWK